MDLIKQKSLQTAENLGNQFSTLAFASRGSPVCDDKSVSTSILIYEIIDGTFDRRRIGSLRRSDSGKHFASPCFRMRDDLSVSQRMDGADSAKHADVIANVVNDASDAFAKVISTSKGRSANQTIAFYRELLFYAGQVLWLSERRILSG